jgi:hypothetical protein
VTSPAPCTASWGAELALIFQKISAETADARTIARHPRPCSPSPILTYREICSGWLGLCAAPADALSRVSTQDSLEDQGSLAGGAAAFPPARYPLDPTHRPPDPRGRPVAGVAPIRYAGPPVPAVP